MSNTITINEALSIFLGTSTNPVGDLTALADVYTSRAAEHDATTDEATLGQCHDEPTFLTDDDGWVLTNAQVASELRSAAGAEIA